MGGWRTIAAVMIASMTTMAMGETSTIASDVAFYASFDASLAPDNFAGAATRSGEYLAKPGRVGQGWGSVGGGASFGCEGNFAHKQGTVSLWYKRDEAIADNGCLFAVTWFELMASTSKQTVFFKTGSMPKGDFAWDYSLTVPLEKIASGAWVHVAMTWAQLASGQMVKSLYIDGQCVKTARVGSFAIDDTGEFRVGSGCAGVFDELMIWNRALTKSEVATLHAQPESVAETMHALPPMVRAKVWRVYPDLVMRNFTDSLVAPNEPFAIEIPLTNRTDQQQSGVLELTLLDLWEKPVGDVVKLPFNIAPKQSTRCPATLRVPMYGAYKVQAAVRIGDDVQMRDITSFGCIPPGNPPKHPFFGLHIEMMTPQEPQMARRLGFSANRSHNQTQYTWWRSMEYDRGVWTMAQRDAYETVNSLGMDHMGQWFAAPNWAVTLPNGKHPDPIALNAYPSGWVPTDIDAYKEYVRQSILRYPKITEWEVWNEPWCSMFWLGSPEDYVKLCKASYEAAKATRPDIRVFAQYADSSWGRAALKAGMMNYCDGVTYHAYVGTEPWNTFVGQNAAIQKDIAKYSKKKNVPVINSECGIIGTTFLRGLDDPSLPPESKREPMDFRLVAERAVQYFVTTMAEGVERFYYYYHTTHATPYRDWSTIEITRTPKPFAVALCILTWQLDSGTFAQHLELAGPVHAYLFDRNDGGSVAVMWTIDDGEVDMKCEGPSFNLMGNPIATASSVRLTATPIYLRSSGASAELAKRLSQATVTIVKATTTRRTVVSEELQPKSMKAFSVASELGENRLIPLNLRPVANMALTDDRPNDGRGGWTDEGSLNDMRDLKPGRYVWLGVPVEVIDPTTNSGKSVFALRGRTFASGPAASSPIRVDRKVRGLFFAHAANLATEKGLVAATYEVRYADGTTQTLPVVVGESVYNWWHDQQDTEESRTVPIRVAEPLESGSPYRFLRLWYWENPKHDVPIASVVLKNDLDNGPCVVLVGVTAAVW